MLADPRQSCVVLLNVTRPSPAGVTEALALRRAKSLSLLAVCKELFAVPLLVLGDYDKAQFSDPIDGSVRRLDVETFALWRDARFTDVLAGSNARRIFLGGAFLEEEVLIAALDGARLGYDVRILSDVTVARQEADRSLVLNRLAHHGILATTMGQVLLEWSVSLDDPAVSAKIQQLLA
jgi:hypothetical protein